MSFTGAIMSTTRLIVWLLILALGLAGCAKTYAPMPAELGQAGETGYLIGPGDQVNIVVWRNPELSMTVPVRPDGKITTPLVEDLGERQDCDSAGEGDRN